MIFKGAKILIIASIICNSLNVIFVIGACLAASRKAKPKHALFRYFTALSNIYCAMASIALVICSIAGNVPRGIILWKYSGTCAVTLTFLTVMLFLGPTMKNYKGLLTGYDFFLHLLCPVLAVVSYIVFEKREFAFYIVIYGFLPIMIYVALYYYKVMHAPEGRRWKDFYGFNRTGKWPISMAAVLLSAFLISVVLWVIH